MPKLPCDFNLHFPNDIKLEYLSGLIGHSHAFFSEMSSLILFQFLNSVVKCLYIFWPLIPYQVCDLQIFSPIL